MSSSQAAQIAYLVSLANEKLATFSLLPFLKNEGQGMVNWRYCACVRMCAISVTKLSDTNSCSQKPINQFPIG